MAFKMTYSSSGIKQTAPLYQEISKSVDADGNIVTTTSTKGTPGTPGYTIKGKPAVLPKPPLDKPPTNYPPTAPGESQGKANIRWKQYLIDNPPPPPPPPSPPNPGGDTPGNITSNVGSPGIPDVDVPAVKGTPGSSSSTIEKAPPKPTTGTLTASVNNKTKSTGDLKLDIRKPDAPNLRPVGRAIADVALLPFDLLKGIFGRKCKGGCKQKFKDSIGVLGGTQSIRKQVFNGGRN